MALRNLYVDEETFNRLCELKGENYTFTEVINKLLDSNVSSVKLKKEKKISLQAY
ncbi:MAG: hypothetical protein GF317_04020 [Candidatus Lokiarchaeota archaeon]|nr:hypothetical protein [Candidatus Lokiarchaeota archaeon]MBD3199053.1 hypothetical protein [Candidatus Lokiarchaeota archaeon]